MKSGKLMGISAMYKFRSDTDMGIGKIAIRRIPYMFNDSAWKKGTLDKEQRRYKTSNRCEMRKSEGLNDLQVVKLKTSKNNDIDVDGLAKEILHGIESRISEKIVNGNSGTMKTDHPDTDESYTVKLDYNVYIAQYDIVMKGYNPLEYAYMGEMKQNIGTCQY